MEGRTGTAHMLREGEWSGVQTVKVVGLWGVGNKGVCIYERGGGGGLREVEEVIRGKSELGRRGKWCAGHYQR